MKKMLVVKKQKNDNSDAEYWSQQTPQQRLDALEEIRQEYNQWKYSAESRFQRVFLAIPKISMCG